MPVNQSANWVKTDILKTVDIRGPPDCCFSATMRLIFVVLCEMLTPLLDSGGYPPSLVYDIPISLSILCSGLISEY